MITDGNQQYKKGILIDLSIISLYYITKAIGLMGRVFANGPGHQSSIPGRVILKKWYLMPPCLTLSIIR